jgi:hypothetical protein
VARAIEAELDAIHAALRDGRLGDLAPQTQALEVLLAEVGPLDAADLHRLRAKAARNQTTLVAAARGIRAAGRRLAEIRAVRDGFLAYGPAGGRDGTAGPGSLTRRF